MSRLAIRAERLCKEFQIGRRQGYGRLSELIVQSCRSAAAAPGRLFGLSRSESAAAGNTRETELFAALRDVSFDVQESEVVGLIGRNGAGKSTLLKVLSRITRPTRGRVGVRGRIGSLLEVGTGFHPELTGRENVFLGGMLLGMSKQEVRRHFDEIVAFSGVETFIDTPVKRYSSGMYVRLGFAIAAFLKPEILVIDEVLAVGDAEFQKRCLQRLDTDAHDGRTVLFVSHNLAAVRDLCSRVIVLEAGEVLFDGDVESGISRYRRQYTDTATRRVRFDCPAPREINLLEAELLTPDTQPGTLPCRGERLQIRLDYLVRQDVCGTNLSLRLNRDGQPVLTSFDIDRDASAWRLRPAGTCSVCISLPSELLKAGHYSVDLDAGRVGTERIDHRLNALQFELTDPPETGADSRLRGYARERAGCLALPLEWVH